MEGADKCRVAVQNTLTQDGSCSLNEALWGGRDTHAHAHIHAHMHPQADAWIGRTIGRT